MTTIRITDSVAVTPDRQSSYNHVDVQFNGTTRERGNPAATPVTVYATLSVSAAQQLAHELNRVLT